MSNRRKPTPSYLHHKQSGRARAVWTNPTGTRQQKLLPGEYDSPESRTAFARLQLELETSPHRLPDPAAAGISVNEVLLAYLTFAEGYYRTADGQPTNEIVELKQSVRPVREVYGETPAAEFGPKKLAAVRQRMITAGLCRTLINRRIDRVKRVFKWASSEELVPVAVYQSLRTLAGLRRGRSEVRESEPVQPVDDATVDATLPHLDPHLRAMVELQRLTGMRPGEVCGLRFAEIDRGADVWVFRPRQHKTTHHERERAIPLGPKARAALAAFLRRDGIPPEGFGHVEPNNPDHRDSRLVMADAYEEAGRVSDATLLRDLARPVMMVEGCAVAGV